MCKCFSKWCKCSMDLAPLWEPGLYCHDGDSNKHLTNVKEYYGKEHFNVATSGATTKTVISRIATVKARNPQKYSLQVGGNNWIVILDSLENFLYDMEFIIKSYKEFLSPENITICNLPYIDPKEKHPILKVSGNKLFGVVNVHLFGLCKDMGVNYCDIFTALRSIFKYKRWCDAIHYGPYGRRIVAMVERKVMGMPYHIGYDLIPEL